MLGKKILVFSIYLSLLCLVFFACASTGTSTAASSGAGRSAGPDWVRDPYTKYDKQANVAAVGSGSSRQAAERNALGNLVGIFGQDIQVDEKLSVSYQEAVQSGAAANWSETTVSDSVISTSAGLDSLVGAEIGDNWDDGRGGYYAVAVLNKAKASQIYTEMVKTNQTMINNLTNIPAAQKNTLEGYSRYQFAAVVADINTSYGNLLSVIGTPVQGLKKGDDYRIEAANITREIPVAVRVQNDRSGRIQGAFNKALSDLGFRTGGANARYSLDVNVAMSPVTIANNPNSFTRIEVTANLRDTTLGSVIMPYNFSSREGHTSQAEADNRAILAAERKINDEYARMLNDTLTQLLPKK